MALGDKVEELQRNVATLQERLDYVGKTLEKALIDHQDTAHRLADLHREHEREQALLKREVEELRKWKDELGRRLWAFGPNIAGAVISGLIAAAVAFLVARR